MWWLAGKTVVRLQNGRGKSGQNAAGVSLAQIGAEPT